MKFSAPNRFFLVAGLLLLAAGLLRPIPAQAKQASPAITIESARVDIWPEYDRPNALVIYNIKLASSVTLPVDIVLRIPAAAGKPYAVAWESPDKALYDLKYDQKIAGDWLEISFSSPATDIRIEYYDPELKKTGAQRDFTFHWPGDYTVNNLTLQVQQPINVKTINFTPNTGINQSAQDGLNYYTIQAGKVNAGTTFDLVLNYSKPDDTLTNPEQFQPAQPSQPINNATSGRVAFNQILPWVIGGAGLLLIAGGLFWYLRSGASSRTAVAPSRPRHGRSASPVPSAPVGSDEDGPFCSQCGKKAGPGDTFCRACGTRLR